MKPILRGKDIKRYSYEWAGEWVINTHNGYTSNLKSKIPPIDIEKYPALKSHLDSHYDTIATRCDQGDTPYHLRNCAYLEDFEKEKIVWASVGFVEYCMIPGLLILDTNYFFEVSKFGNTKNYLLGLLNSKLLTFWLKAKNTPLGDMGAYRNYKYNIMELPMVKITAKNKKIADKIIALVDKILQSKAKDPKANTQGLEKEIDALIYQLYNLTDEEIKTIEEGQEIKS
ncbi:TaqI-like C-terminal specificity domain-containing protein [Helicobacter pylori]|uniref:TaqI-like C-terminal specificity domain-containing protein n=1 Tax=Helicobacter pylori TaxID=210 RepID=UPI003F86C02B